MSSKLSFLLLFLVFQTITPLIAQETGNDNSFIYTDSTGQVYVKTGKPIFFFIKPTEGNERLVALPTEGKDTLPLIFDREGTHYIAHRSAQTGKNVRFKLVADGTSPKTAVTFSQGLLFVYNNTYFVEVGAMALVNASDNLSGVNQTFISSNVTNFELYTGDAIPFNNSGETALYFYTTDRVGNSEAIKTIRVFVAQDATVEMENIYFDLNSSKLRNESFSELNRLANLLKTYPKVRIELRAHTDSRGNSAYNLKLSEDRAQNTLEYLVARGVPGWRIEAKGFGDTMPVNDCNKGERCTEELHRQNRRVEIIISKIQEEGNN